MKIKEIVAHTQQVKPYEKGTHMMWTDDHISKHLLQAHINPDINVASRKATTIDKLVEWIKSTNNLDKGEILDLGCGPGLYTQRLALAGYKVTGIDFSENSIRYAREQNDLKGLTIEYSCLNYLELDYDAKFDVIIMIYCDFGVLNPEERGNLIQKIYKALKPGGTFIFDTLNEKIVDKKVFSKQWEASEGGFWQEKPYLCLTDAMHFPEKRALLDQHTVISEDDSYKIYRFWNHYLDIDEVKLLFDRFTKVTEFPNLLNGTDQYNDETVTFYQIKK